MPACRRDRQLDTGSVELQFDTGTTTCNILPCEGASAADDRG